MKMLEINEKIDLGMFIGFFFFGKMSKQLFLNSGINLYGSTPVRSVGNLLKVIAEKKKQ